MPGVLVALAVPAILLNAHQTLIVQEEKSATLVNVFSRNAGLTMTAMVMKNALAMNVNLLTALQVPPQGNTGA